MQVKGGLRHEDHRPMSRKTTPEKPPSRSELSTAGRGTTKPSSLTRKEIQSLAGRVLSEGNKRK